MSKEIRTVGVVGLGTMGSGIAQVCVQAGFDVVAREVTSELAERGRKGITGQLDKAVERGKLDAATRDDTLARLTTTDDLGALASCDLVIEAVIEEIALKRELFQTLEGLRRPGRDPRYEHERPLGHADRRFDRHAGARGRPALLQPGTCPPARRGRSSGAARRTRHSTGRSRSRRRSASSPSPVVTHRGSS